MSKLVLICMSSLIVQAAALLCDNLSLSDDLPCTEVPRCNGQQYAHITVDQLSNGYGDSKSYSDISLCFDDDRLYVNHVAHKQVFLTPTSYTQCNDPVFNSNVGEFFVAPYMESEPHCYNELDISPFNVMFDAGIYNPNLNRSGIVGSEFECSSSGITNSVVQDSENETWSASMSFPFSLLNCPFNCPLKQYCGHSTPNNIYRANFFRINELVETASCTSSTCEYMAWSPTMVDPPAFHEPTKFGYLLLQL